MPSTASTSDPRAPGALLRNADQIQRSRPLAGPTSDFYAFRPATQDAAGNSTAPDNGPIKRKLEQRHCRQRTVLATVPELGRQARFRLGNPLFVAVQLPDSPGSPIRGSLLLLDASRTLISEKPVSGQRDEWTSLTILSWTDWVRVGLFTSAITDVITYFRRSAARSSQLRLEHFRAAIQRICDSPSS